MSQGSIVIPTTGTLSGQQLVILINEIAQILSTNSSGPTDPSTLVGGVAPFSLWLDTSVTPRVLRIRNELNTAWAVMGTFNGNNFVPDITSGDVIAALGYTPVNKAGDDFTGDVTAPNFHATSDARLKSSPIPLTNALEKVMAMCGVSYTKFGKEEIGFVAQDVQQIEPRLVSQNAEGFLTLAYGNVTALLVEAVKELAARVAELEAKG